MLGNRSVTNEKPRLKAATSNQGNGNANVHSNSTMFGNGKSRHDKGMELYKAGKVSIGSNGLFKVSGYYDVDTEKMTCTCPDYRIRKEPCKHIYAACLFVNNRGKAKIENLNGQNWTDELMNDQSFDKPKVEVHNKPAEARCKDFDRQATITRLAVLNTATEILKTHNKPITVESLFKVACQLEKWALGGE